MGLPQVFTRILSRTAEDSSQKYYLFALLPSHVDAVEKRKEQRIFDDPVIKKIDDSPYCGFAPDPLIKR